jgi:hypothetical protein
MSAYALFPLPLLWMRRESDLIPRLAMPFLLYPGGAGGFGLLRGVPAPQRARGLR